MHARIGELERALKEVQLQRDDARRKLREKGPSDGDVVALRRDLDHAVGHMAVAGGCARCTAIRRRLQVDRPRYENAAELADEMNAAHLVRHAARLVLGYVGARDRFRAQAAFEVFRLVDAGSLAEASRALERLSRSS